MDPFIGVAKLRPHQSKPIYPFFSRKLRIKPSVESQLPSSSRITISNSKTLLVRVRRRRVDPRRPRHVSGCGREHQLSSSNRSAVIVRCCNPTQRPDPIPFLSGRVSSTQTQWSASASGPPRLRLFNTLSVSLSLSVSKSENQIVRRERFARLQNSSGDCKLQNHAQMMNYLLESEITERGKRQGYGSYYIFILYLTDI
ncbi:uncharacterized protein LOC126610325 [Malus sylvestris]|uniref:uncharacterized protein LOC126610325 n=1 Tax=Malus sylvestris TaxID=3752 RepID=UPI0007EDC228|nr:uncharacterized protein LOC108171726 [Malus domestica]XP_050134332.1 uncharacterized protein LOC126610325 [Malus sylvestris]